MRGQGALVLLVMCLWSVLLFLVGWPSAGGGNSVKASESVEECDPLTEVHLALNRAGERGSAWRVLYLDGVHALAQRREPWRELFVDCRSDAVAEFHNDPRDRE